MIPSNADAAEGAAQTRVLVLTVNGDARWQFLFSRPDFFIFDFFFIQRNWECQAGLECIMHAGKELGQCVDIDECTVNFSPDKIICLNKIICLDKIICSAR